ncbi:RPAP1-like, carboxy-terminal protein [Actinidia rufa]|uniref:RPAP1-like, carboxy-terminal protein n=1 Tax=Actinidia rufa TaxID=165716 RepID=A0A7J0F780_9ERIC|nr:RPAP1-like, carboxy-terminal protein [Actinidia rufa]
MNTYCTLFSQIPSKLPRSEASECDSGNPRRLGSTNGVRSLFSGEEIGALKNVSAKDLPSGEDMNSTMQRINSVLGVCLIVGPRDGFIMDKSLDMLLQVPVLKNRWLAVKKETEGSRWNQDHSCTSLDVEWAHQRLPLPMHWFLSPISTINGGKRADLPRASNIINRLQDLPDFLEVAKGGLFLSFRDTGVNYGMEFPSFQSEIHESYSTFLETLVEQFAAVSYGDLIYCRQVALYLHLCVETSVWLATWTALSNTRVLELLPPLENCVAKAEGFLEPVEEFLRVNLLTDPKRSSGGGVILYSLSLGNLS